MGVVVTGIGAITPIGVGAQALWQGVLAGRSAVRRLTHFDPAPFRTQIAAEVPHFDPAEFLDTREIRRLDRFAQFAIVTARLAVADSYLDLDRVNRQRVGLVVGTALGGVGFAEEQHTRYLDGGPRAVQPSLALAVYGGAASAQIALDLGFTGPTCAPASGCASGAVALGEAVRLIQRGEVDVVLAGAVEAPLAPLTFGAFALIRAMSTRNEEPGTASRPFDTSRDGFVMAEGAAILVLESERHARRRGAPIYGRILGFGQTTDAHHMTAPRPDGAEAARAMTMALADAGLPPESIGYVKAHASATPLGDCAEAAALHRALGQHALSVPVSGTKGLHGHPLGAAGAIEAAITLLALKHRYLPPTTNCRDLDPAIDLNVIRDAGIADQVEHALAFSCGFGGVNAALVLRAP